MEHGKLPEQAPTEQPNSLLRKRGIEYVTGSHPQTPQEVNVVEVVSRVATVKPRDASTGEEVTVVPVASSAPSLLPSSLPAPPGANAGATVNAAGKSESSGAEDPSEEKGKKPRKRAKRWSPAEDKRRSGQVALKGFLGSLDDYDPTLPVEAAAFHAQRGGLDVSSNKHIATFLSLVADHLIVNIVHDCAKYRDLRMQREGELEKEQRAVANASERVLTKEDLTVSLASRGVATLDAGSLVKSAGAAALEPPADDDEPR